MSFLTFPLICAHLISSADLLCSQEDNGSVCIRLFGEELISSRVEEERGEAGESWCRGGAAALVCKWSFISESNIRRL